MRFPSRGHGTASRKIYLLGEKNYFPREEKKVGSQAYGLDYKEVRDGRC